MFKIRIEENAFIENTPPKWSFTDMVLLYPLLNYTSAPTSLIWQSISCHLQELWNKSINYKKDNSCPLLNTSKLEETGRPFLEYKLFLFILFKDCTWRRFEIV